MLNAGCVQEQRERERESESVRVEWRKGCSRSRRAVLVS